MRLGLRLAVAGGRRGLGLTAFGVALGTAVLLLALTIDPAIDARAARLAWREPTALALSPTEPQTRVAVIAGAYRDASMTRVLVAATHPRAPVPPGIPELPAPGTSYLSSALADLGAAVPPGELGDRFGRVVGEIADVALADPGELVAVMGVTPDALPNALSITTFEAPGDPPTAMGFLRIALAIGVVGLLAPVAIFVATATRLSAANRAERLATVRLVGATPGQARLLAATEALVAGGIGALGGVLLFLLLRPVGAMLPFLGHRWFVDDLTPDLVLAAGTVLAIPVISVGAALFGLRDALASPLMTTRQATPPTVGPARLLPLLGAIVLLAAAVMVEAMDRGALGELSLYAMGGAFLLVVSALVWAGPYLVSLAARVLRRIARRPATLIAAHRLMADARAGFYTISGVVLAVFIGSVFHALVVPITSSVDPVTRSGLRPDVVRAVEVNLFQVGSATLDRIRAELEQTGGVARVVIERDVELITADGTPIAASVMACSDASAVLALAIEQCGHADLLAAGAFEPGTYEVTAEGVEPGTTWHGAVTVQTVGSFTPPGDVHFTALLQPSALPDAGASLAPSRILVATDGSPGAIERARTVIEHHLPASIVLTGAGEASLAAATVHELTWLVNFGIAGVMFVAGATLAISVIAGLIERRRPLAILRLTGVPMSQLRRLVLIEVFGPLVAASLVTAVAGIGIAQLVARLGLARDLALPGPSILAPVGVGLAGALVVVLAILPFLERTTAVEATRFE